MSNRYLTPSNLFYHWSDPTPNPSLPEDPFKDFPQPNTGDIYFNVSSNSIRVFYEGGWHDAGSGGGGGGGGDEVAIQPAEPSSAGLDLWVDTNDTGTFPTNFIVSTSPPADPPHAYVIETVWLQY